jgi:adenosylcobinamide kinase/adenosylcobinamide-phosphate guanylyltransferase
MSSPGGKGAHGARRKVTLVTGGARSGKSRYALELAAPYPQRAFVATAEAIDDEMRDRIRRHRDERGEFYATVEEPVDLAAALGRLPAGTGVAVVDCLTVWLGNLVYRRGEGNAAAELGDLPEVGAFLAAVSAPPCSLVLVSNEVGLGVVPENALARGYVDLLGRINQEVAARAERVVFLVSGLPLALKGDQR